MLSVSSEYQVLAAALVLIHSLIPECDLAATTTFSN